LFKEQELRPIKNSNLYHSPEVSETDEESPTGKRKIVTKDLKWRSNTVRKDKFYMVEVPIRINLLILFCS
jgi:hypothetical protein